jgi:N-acetylglucosamine malate deacetylase 2
MNRAIGIFAHPDDEAIIIGGTLIQLAELGWETHLICATKGEASTAYDRDYVKKEELGPVREQELLRAAEIMGIKKVHFLDYIDATLVDQDEAEAVEKLAALLNTLQPELIYTFEVNGISHHPDHKTVHRWMMKLLHEGKLNYMPLAVYLATVDNRAGRLKNGLLMGSPIEEITTIIDIERVADQKAKAILAHRTQMKMLINNGLIVDGALQRNHRHEYFIKLDGSGQPVQLKEKETQLPATR